MSLTYEYEVHAADKYEPPPQPGKTVVSDYVLADIHKRIIMGLEKYGTKLQTNNGRDALWDKYQELLDAIFYARQEILEKEEETKSLCQVYALLAENPHLDKAAIAESVSLLRSVLARRHVVGVE